MSDHELRELERRFRESRSLEDHVAWLRARMRVDSQIRWAFGLAAGRGVEAARLALGDDAPENPLRGLDRVAWGRYGHVDASRIVFRDASRIAVHLRGLLSENPADSFEQLWDSIIHEEDGCYPATSVVVPFLIQLVTHPHVRVRASVVSLLRAAAFGTHRVDDPLDREATVRRRAAEAGFGLQALETMVEPEAFGPDMPERDGLFFKWQLDSHRAVAGRLDELLPVVHDSDSEAASAVAALVSLFPDPPEGSVSSVLEAIDGTSAEGFHASGLIAVARLARGPARSKVFERVARALVSPSYPRRLAASAALALHSSSIPDAVGLVLQEPEQWEELDDANAWFRRDWRRSLVDFADDARRRLAIPLPGPEDLS